VWGLYGMRCAGTFRKPAMWHIAMSSVNVCVRLRWDESGGVTLKAAGMDREMQPPLGTNFVSKRGQWF